MFNTGDTVSYGTSGVCTIAEKKRLTLGGQPHECFILRPVFDASMKICVPCDSTPLLQKMRAMPTRDELLSLLREPAPTHDPDPEVRRETYREALKSGSLHELIAMVRDIYTERTLRRAKGKQLSAYEDSPGWFRCLCGCQGQSCDETVLGDERCGHQGVPERHRLVPCGL